MRVAAEDRTKVAFLLVAIIALLCYLLMVVLPQWLARIDASSAAVGDRSGQRKSASTDSRTTFADSTAVSPEADVLDIDSSVPVPSTRDPFRPPAGIAGAAIRVTGDTAPVRYDNRRPDMRLPGGLNRFEGMESPLSIARVERPTPTVELKGVIPGDPSLAIVNIDGQLFYKYIGESVGDGWAISRITEAGILLRQGQSTLDLQVGHTVKPAAMPPPAPVRTPPAPRQRSATELVPQATAQPRATPLAAERVEGTNGSRPAKSSPVESPGQSATATPSVEATAALQVVRPNVNRISSRRISRSRYSFSGRRL